MSSEFEQMLQECQRMEAKQAFLTQIGLTIDAFSNQIESRRPDRMMEFTQLMTRLMNHLDAIAEYKDEFEKGRLTITVRFQKRRKPTVLSISLWQEE